MKIHLILFSSFLIILNACNSRTKRATSEKSETSDSTIAMEKDFIFSDNRPFAQCHASTLVRTNDGQFLVAWFGGTHEKHDDVGIWLSKGNPQHWSAPVEVAKLREDPHWNPVSFTAPSG